MHRAAQQPEPRRLNRNPEEHHAEARQDSDGDGQHQEKLLLANRNQARRSQHPLQRLEVLSPHRRRHQLHQPLPASLAQRLHCKTPIRSRASSSSASSSGVGLPAIFFRRHLCLEGESQRALDDVIPPAQLALVHHGSQLIGPSRSSLLGCSPAAGDGRGAVTAMPPQPLAVAIRKTSIVRCARSVPSDLRRERVQRFHPVQLRQQSARLIASADPPPADSAAPLCS